MAFELYRAGDLLYEGTEPLKHLKELVQKELDDLHWLEGTYEVFRDTDDPDVNGKPLVVRITVTINGEEI